MLPLNFFVMANMAAQYVLHILGDCQLVDKQAHHSVGLRTRKAKCLLGLLALWPNATMSREKLASFLWDPAPDEQARASLRQCLKEIRDFLREDGSQVLVSDRSTIGLDIGKIDVDALALQQQLPAAKDDRALALKLARMWKGELFGEILPAAPVFEAWVQVERSKLLSAVSTLLSDHLSQQLAAQDFADQNIANELLRLEPCHELAHQYLMQFHAMRGDQAGALRQFETLAKALAVDLDSEPSVESMDLLVAIKKGDIRSAVDLAPFSQIHLQNFNSPPHGPPKIAIRPPLTRYSDGSKDYLAEGFANLVKVNLSRFRCWIILSWPSSGFDSKIKVDFTALGASIGVDYILDPVLDWRGDQGRLFMSFVDCRDGSEIWSDVFPVNESELQSLSSIVAGTVASRLASRINHITLLRYARTTPGNSAAYDTWLRGHQLSRAWTVDADLEAQVLFVRAIEQDPGLACSYASLASVLSTQSVVRPGYANTEQDRKRAFDLAHKSISLDPFDSRNHIAVAWNWLLAGSAQRAESHFTLALELNPYDSETLIASAMGMAFIGRIDLAVQWSKTALELNPLHPEYFLIYLAGIRYLAGDYAGTVQTIKHCPDMFLDKNAWAAAAHARLGEKAEAIAAYSRFVEAVTAKWEGENLPTATNLHDWLFSILPVIWKEGRRNLESDFLNAHKLFLLHAPPN
jgi:DNA-binding SARP family transcriptional activator/TolB-like protein